jgi:hypothetical protein
MLKPTFQKTCKQLILLIKNPELQQIPKLAEQLRVQTRAMDRKTHRDMLSAKLHT